MMISNAPTVRAAAVHAAPVMLNKESTLAKVETLVAEAARNGAQLVVLGESFLPGFPVWNLVHSPLSQHGFFAELHRHSVTVPGPETETLGRIASKYDVVLSIGVSERCSTGPGTMWNSNLLFDEAGTLINHRRKMMPTWAEGLSWAMGDASGLHPVETRCGPVGVLICGENFNTLARFSLLAQGELIHLSTYPPAWPTSWSTDPGEYDLAEAIRIRSAAHAIEGKVFNVVAACHFDQSSMDLVSDDDERVSSLLRSCPQGVSMILGPTGNYLAGPVQNEEAILYADIDLSAILPQRELHDITGHYNRFDIFSLTVRRSRPAPVEIDDSGTAYDSTRESETPGFFTNSLDDVVAIGRTERAPWVPGSA